MATTRIILEASSGRIVVEGTATIGRAAENDVVLDDLEVSRNHARVEQLEDGTFLLIDLGSSNGTRLNGRGLRAPARLRSGDVVGLGGAEITFTVEGSAATAPEPEPEPSDQTITSAHGRGGRSMIGQSPAMLEVFHLVGVAARSTLPVLVEGETGTGKELTARAIHDASPRAAKPFLAINCATLVEGLLESELFGHRRGAFTGADRDHAGLFESAGGGTVFLDEIGEMPMSTQPKLLRVLEEAEVVRLGETRPRPIDVRIVSATNRNLEEAVEGGSFRRDLFFRLAIFPLRLPPLRERQGDVPLLVRHALSLAAASVGRRIPGTTDRAAELLAAYDWPGNARELRNELQRAVELVADGERIDARHLSERLRRGGGESVPPSAGTATLDSDLVLESDALPDGPGADLRSARAAFEAEHILRVLEQNGGHIGKTATALGLSRTALYKKFKDYGIER